MEARDDGHDGRFGKPGIGGKGSKGHNTNRKYDGRYEYSKSCAYFCSENEEYMNYNSYENDNDCPGDDGISGTFGNNCWFISFLMLNKNQLHSQFFSTKII